MAVGSFQIPPGFAATTLSGLIQAEVVDVNGNPPQDIIKAGQAFGVKYRWELLGSAVPMIAGQWLLRVLFDEIGTLNDGFVPAQPLQVALTPATGAYDATIDFPAGLTAGPGGSSYQIIASLSYLNAAGTPGGMGGSVNCGLLGIQP
ncbi:hypothetical protein ABGB17_04605 [Sphaerisporangium sp. B11E5]|uniref:hypothetical protein n=1 Tax=Sphaerisporangium sp. B11E5 TaxID=3153563 RepID=UPI00325E1B4E